MADEEPKERDHSGEEPAEEKARDGEQEGGQEEHDGAAQGDGGGESPTSGGGQPAHQRLARDLDRQADELEDRSSEVGQHIDETRADWERKQTSESVPGAVGEPASDRSAGNDS